MKRPEVQKRPRAVITKANGRESAPICLISKTSENATPNEEAIDHEKQRRERRKTLLRSLGRIQRNFSSMCHKAPFVH